MQVRLPSITAFCLFLAAVASATTGAARGARSSQKISATIGASVVTLNGPWRFHIGDNPRWSGLHIDDSRWKQIDLSAAQGSHDPDVGLTGYVPGWTADGYPTYSGYAWYRTRVTLSASRAALSLAGPPLVDDAYQLYFNGRLLGGSGDFSRSIPTTYSTEPKVFRLPCTHCTTVIAIRVWMSPDSLSPGAGGIHIAPLAGESSAVGSRYDKQWRQLVLGYIVEIVEALAFVLLAVMAFVIRGFERNSAYWWLIAALLIIATFRANQAFVAWTEVESLAAYNILVNVLLIPAVLGAWTMAWCAWFNVRFRNWVFVAVAVLTTLYAAAQFLDMQQLSTWLRPCFALIIVFSVVSGFRHNIRDTLAALPAVVFMSVALFSTELSELGVPGIWFPFGVGVSLSQFAYAAFDLALFVVLWHRLRTLAPERFIQSRRVVIDEGLRR